MSKEWTEEERRIASERAKRQYAERQAAAEAGEGEVVEVAPAADDLDLADFERQAVEDGILTLDDILQVRIEAKQKIILEQRAAAKKKLVEQAMETERRKAGLISPTSERGKWLAEKVTYTVRLPKQGPRDVPEHRVDGRIFSNGRTYEVTRAEYMSLVATEQAAWHHQAQIMGQSRTYYDELLGSMVYQGGVARGSGGMA